MGRDGTSRLMRQLLATALTVTLATGRPGSPLSRQRVRAVVVD